MIATLTGLSLASALLAPAPQSAAGNTTSTFHGTYEGGALEVIDFESFVAGTIVSSVTGSLGSGPIQVAAMNPALGMTNAAVVFDSSNPTGEDPDLGTPNEDFGGPGIGAGGELGAPYQNDTPQGNLLIIAEDLVDGNGDGLVDDPDDADVEGALYRFDYGAIGTVTVYQMTIIDVEDDEMNADVRFFGPGGVPIAMELLPHTGNNGRATVTFGDGISGVRRMIVDLNGSGAIDDIVFSRDTCNPCITVDVECISPSVAGDPIEITGTVTNCGDAMLREVAVLDDKLGLLLTNVVLAPGESVGFGGFYGADLEPGTCSTNTTQVMGKPPFLCGGPVMASDSSECCIPEEVTGEGCTPGYWKQPQHFDSWPAPYTPGMLFSDVFEDAFPGMTLVQVLDLGGGGLEALGRHTVAALLNSANGEVDYGLTPGEVVDLFNDAYPGGDYEGLKDFFEGKNEAGCPLN